MASIILCSFNSPAISRVISEMAESRATSLILRLKSLNDPVHNRLLIPSCILFSLKTLPYPLVKELRLPLIIIGILNSYPQQIQHISSRVSARGAPEIILYFFWSKTDIVDLRYFLPVHTGHHGSDRWGNNRSFQPGALRSDSSTKRPPFPDWHKVISLGGDKVG